MPLVLADFFFVRYGAFRRQVGRAHKARERTAYDNKQGKGPTKFLLWERLKILTLTYLEKSREFLHKRKCQEQKSSKGYAAQVVAREELKSEPRSKKEAVETP